MGDDTSILLVTDDPSGAAGGVVGLLLESRGHSHAVLRPGLVPDLDEEIDFRLDPEIVVIDGSTSARVARDLTARVRRMTDAPVLVVVPDELEEASLVALYESGADHCVARSSSERLLLAKLDAIRDGRLRRREKLRNAPLAGTTLDGRYRILEKLGRGGMGVVFLVKHLASGERRALKMLLARGSLEPRAAERFEREIAALGSVVHDNIVRIHDAGRSGPTVYYVMDHLPGGSLADRLDEEGPMGAVTALGLVAKIADAVHHLHGRGILHRDVKCDNILFDADDEPVLTDFGLALDMHRERITGDGYTVGTVRAMSPEQLCKPETLDARSDVYGLGVLLFEALTGAAPFGDSSKREDLNDVLGRILQGQTPNPRQIDRSIPAQAAAVCRRALARDREDRHPSAAVFAAHCRNAIRGIAIAAARRRTAAARAIAPAPRLAATG